MQLDKNIRDWFDSTDKLFDGISCLIKPIRKKKKQKVHVIFAM
jgi:hypothetical protein